MMAWTHTLPTLAENLALDEALLAAAEAGECGEVLRLWELPFLGVVLGASGKLADEVDRAACQRDGVPIARRGSGGGTVLLGPGCLCFSCLLDLRRRPELRNVTASYRLWLGRIAAALRLAVPDLAATLAGQSDLAADGWKFSGNAQKRGRDFLLHHGTLLYAFDLAAMPIYLRQPVRQPAYRGDRPHGDFVRNLPAEGAALRAALCHAGEAVEAAPEAAFASALARVPELVARRHGNPAWTERC